VAEELFPSLFDAPRYGERDMVSARDVTEGEQSKEGTEAGARADKFVGLVNSPLQNWCLSWISGQPSHRAGGCVPMMRKTAARG